MFSVSPLIRQWLIVITANLSSFGAGVVTSWSSPMVPKLLDANSTILASSMTDDEATWVTSIFLVVTIPLSPIIPILLNRVGRRNTILLTYIPKFLGCLLLIIGREVWHLILARLLDGIFLCIACIAIPTYASEIAEKSVRGALGCLSQISMSIGVTVTMIVGPVVSYTALSLGYLVAMVVCFLPLLILPESPYFLYSKGKTEESIKLLNLLRRSDDETHEELQMYAENVKAKQTNICQAWKKMNFLKAFAITCLIGLGSQMTGFNFISLYFQTMMQSTGTIRPELASMVYGLVQLVSCSIPAFVSDRIGRKPLLCGTMLMVALGMAGLGTFFWMKESGHPIGTFLNYLPLVASIIVNIGYSGGIGALIFVIIPELFEGPERGLGVTSGFTCLAVAVSILSKCYSTIISGIGAPATYWMFSGGSVAFCLFIAFCIPETKGKIFSEIQKELRNSEKTSSGIKEGSRSLP